VRAGAPKPDISSVAVFKRALLDATSISWAPHTETGEHLAKVFERLGLGEEIKLRSKPQQEIDQVTEAVIAGSAELAITVTSLLTIPGMELVGKIPPELQGYVTFTAGVGTASEQQKAANALIRHLRSPAARSPLAKNGWEPVHNGTASIL
jgi:molybdate transport system substrate-binding protein